MKKFLLKTLIYVSILAIITAGLNIAYIDKFYIMNFGTMGTQRNNSALIKNVPDNIQVCNFGTSHSFYGFNYEDAEKKYTCFNFALPAQSMLYDYNILQNYRDKIQDGAVAFIALSYFSFFGKPEVQEVDFASRNRRYYKFLAKELIINYDAITNFYVKYLPALTFSNVIRFMNFAKSIFEPDQDVWFKTADVDDSEVRYKGHVANKLDNNGRRLYNKESIEALYNLIALCKELGATPILITTPYLHEYVDAVKRNDPKFFDDFYGIINEVTAKTGIKYYDYSSDERYTNNHEFFFNTDHLNRNGARQFTKDIMREAAGL
ncbi:MAG: SGNH/GDSL hydrolase family protein [Synergistaceae bacterium]|nr:SGNH/GDSL hydrolase family protein [Synergistaceae bacterium]